MKSYTNIVLAFLSVMAIASACLLMGAGIAFFFFLPHCY